VLSKMRNGGENICVCFANHSRPRFSVFLGQPRSACALSIGDNSPCSVIIGALAQVHLLLKHDDLRRTNRRKGLVK
jgi:hypothetical protein